MVPKSLIAGVAHDPRHAGLGIDLDFGDMAAIREGRRRILGGVIDVERSGTPSGILPSRSRCASSMMPIERSVPAMVKRPPANSMSPSAASIRCAAACLPFAMTSAEDFDDRRAGRGDRARAAGAVAEAHEVAVVLLQRDLLEGHAELRGQHLRERRGVALAVIQRAGGELHRAVRLERDLAEFAARRRRDFEIGADRDAAQLAVPCGFPSCAWQNWRDRTSPAPWSNTPWKSPLS